MSVPSIVSPKVSHKLYAVGVYECSEMSWVDGSGQGSWVVAVGRGCGSWVKIKKEKKKEMKRKKEMKWKYSCKITAQIRLMSMKYFKYTPISSPTPTVGTLRTEDAVGRRRDRKLFFQFRMKSACAWLFLPNSRTRPEEIWRCLENVSCLKQNTIINRLSQLFCQLEFKIYCLFMGQASFLKLKGPKLNGLKRFLPSR